MRWAIRLRLLVRGSRAHVGSSMPRATKTTRFSERCSGGTAREKKRKGRRLPRHREDHGLMNPRSAVAHLLKALVRHLSDGKRRIGFGVDRRTR